jgi:hypothetical protein
LHSPNLNNRQSFLIGTWEGKGKTKLDDGTVAEYTVTWIGRYILDGTAIADECHGPAPDGSPYLGINLRQYDRNRQTWVVEYLNVSGSFLRKLVDSHLGSVTVRGRNVTVASESPGMSYRERYDVEMEATGFFGRIPPPMAERAGMRDGWR